jgi:hypothetical protein
MFCVIAGRAMDHSKCVTTAHPLDRQPAGMFSNVVVGVKELEAGRDAPCLARALTSAIGNLTLAHVQVVAPAPAPDTGAAGGAARRQDALERLAALRDADLLVIAASRQDEIYRDLVGRTLRTVRGLAGSRLAQMINKSCLTRSSVLM